MEVLASFAYTPSAVRGGYTDRILHVNLTTNELSVQEISKEFHDKFVGGRGYALKLVWDLTTQTTKYDSPENVLVMAGGPLCNEPRFPGSGKFIVGTISPLTDTFIDSNIGGHFAPLLKLCGFDALAITGIALRHTALHIDGDRGVIELVSAPEADTEVERGSISYGELLMKSVNEGGLSENVAAVTTGIGAETSRFGIVNSLFYDKRRDRVRVKQAGRGGTGTVMRHKGLRGIIVKSNLPRVNGNNPIDPEGVKKAGANLKKVLAQMDPQQLRLGSWGTTGLTEYMNKFFILPINNYQFGQGDDAEKVFADVFLDRYFSPKLPDGCYIGCNLACAKGAEDVELTRGPYAGRKVGVDGPEYETVAAVLCMGITDPQFIMEYNWYCDEYGLDTISTGVSMAFLMECFQRGYLTENDFGYDLSFGNVESANRLFHEIAANEGLGRICGQGVHRAKQWVAGYCASKNGASAATILEQVNVFGMEVKGLEFSMYNTKESLAQQGGYGFALKGPQHDEAWLIFLDQVNNEMPSFEEKAEALKWFPLFRTWFNAVGLCKLPWIDVRHPDAAATPKPAQNMPTIDYYAQYLSATIGASKSTQDILEDSERLQLQQKLLNLRQGKGLRENDQIPARAMGPAFLNEYQARSDYYDEWLRQAAGSSDIPQDAEERRRLIMKLRSEAYQVLCDSVYKIKGYNSNAVPLVETVKRFGLYDDQARELLARYGETG